MKKILVIALMLGTGLAYAASLGVPWFVDNAAIGSNPPAAGGTLGIVYLHSNATEVLTVTIEYFTGSGDSIGPLPGSNTFDINPSASIAFRPVAEDSVVEGVTYLLVPNRPRTTILPNDNKKNGSIVLSWSGALTDLQGSYKMVASTTHAISTTDPTLVYTMSGYGHLLPPGTSG